ncbi:MAG: hypothetical protein NT099_06890 [Candidatus Saganbacteria bacterium]|nr:hypothetical protein [Candidatus Saganbacteria bacterium]
MQDDRFQIIDAFIKLKRSKEGKTKNFFTGINGLANKLNTNKLRVSRTVHRWFGDISEKELNKAIGNNDLLKNALILKPGTIARSEIPKWFFGYINVKSLFIDPCSKILFFKPHLNDMKINNIDIFQEKVNRAEVYGMRSEGLMDYAGKRSENTPINLLRKAYAHILTKLGEYNYRANPGYRNKINNLMSINEFEQYKEVLGHLLKLIRRKEKTKGNKGLKNAKAGRRPALSDKNINSLVQIILGTSPADHEIIKCKKWNSRGFGELVMIKFKIQLGKSTSEKYWREIKPRIF